MEALRRLIKDCLTENDGKSYCPFRVSGCFIVLLGVPAFILLEVWSVVQQGHTFDMTAFGAAFGEMMTGIGILSGAATLKGKVIEDRMSQNGE